MGSCSDTDIDQCHKTIVLLLRGQPNDSFPQIFAPTINSPQLLHLILLYEVERNYSNTGKSVLFQAKLGL